MNVNCLPTTEMLDFSYTFIALNSALKMQVQGRNFFDGE